MLVGFSVKNFKSFKEPQSISFIASKISRHKEHTFLAGNKKILKSGLIYGANAGGKSNLIKAVHFSREIVLFGLDSVDLNKKYFRIDKEEYKKPGVFEYRIIINQNEYSYGIAISYFKKEIISEWLVRIEKNGEETYLFNRNVDESGVSHIESEIAHGTQEENTRMRIYLEDFGENISESFRRKTILSDIALRGNDKQKVFAEIAGVYQWFTNIIVIFPNSKYNGLNEVATDNDKKLFFSKIMSYFDTGIESIEGQCQAMDFDKILEDLPREELERIKIDISNEASENPIMFKLDNQVFILRKDENGDIIYNKMLLNHGNSEDLFEYADESDGTKRLFDLVPLFYENKRNSVIMIDEIDRSLHTVLIRRFLERFYSITKDSNCQLIATTHDSNLLDLELLRQDEIWFVERQEDHSSRIYSLNKFKERFDKRIEKDYLLGRYGAIPIFDEEKF
ncbi:ATP-binding protein [Ruminiclostridium herbifermentans]|uniref:ATP-binding protein n=1 Tax=Ruminiclostridium herbifermentans TaxID=2488810 RepID=A0A4U7JH90_9FIRM|nr:ATP-binding protein [Ruminiclostridium herbifermentans]QNU65963.1 ATP-binding protein [Ruminiclostridium herbifermentans]